MSITYQQAKRIRKTGLMSLFADQLMYEKKVTTAIKKTISLKTRGRIMGLTQYLDPLNIAKMMTFGSSLGPALLGHWMGRDPRDIQYFTGRFKPIRERTTGDKLTKLGKPGSGNIEGVSSVLRKMYKLLAGTHEENLKRLELTKNREEEHQLEEERRHKELMDVLAGLGFGGKKKSKLAAAGDFLSSIWKKLMPIIAMMVKKAVQLAMKAYAWIKDLYKWMRNSGKFGEFFKKAAPWMKAGIAFELLTHSGEVGAGSDKVDRVDIHSEEAKLNPWAMVARGEAKTVDEAFEKVRAAKNGAPPDRAEIEMAAHMDDLTEPQRKKLYGADKEQMREWLKIHQDPKSIFTPETVTKQQTGPKKTATETKKEVKPTPAAPVPPVVKTTKNKLNDVQSEHTNNRIAKGVLVRKPKTTVNKNTVNKQKNPTAPLKRRMPSVRNEETEFRNRMLDNTVVKQ